MAISAWYVEHRLPCFKIILNEKEVHIINIVLVKGRFLKALTNHASNHKY